MTGEIKGMNLTRWDCEMLALAKITVSNREREADLMGRKWFDYREYHPVQATYLFAHFYEDAVKTAYVQTRDKNSADKVKTFRSGDIFNSPELLSVWRARQHYDALGLRYDFALRYVMKRFADRGWRMFPRPNQLYSEELLLDLRDVWTVECKASLQIAKGECYRADQLATRDRLAYQDWMIKQVMMRELPYIAAARLVNEGIFTLDDLKARLPNDVVARAKSRIIVKSKS